MFNKGKYFLGKIRVYQYPILKNLRVGIRVSSTGFHSNWSNSVRFVDIIPVPGAKNVKTKDVKCRFFLEVRVYQYWEKGHKGGFKGNEYS